MHISDLTEQQIDTLSLDKLREYLYPGDVKAIARSTGFADGYIFYVIRGVRNSEKIDLAVRERIRQNRSLSQFRKENSHE
jgi:hypothetical protein